MLCVSLVTLEVLTFIMPILETGKVKHEEIKHTQFYTASNLPELGSD